MVDNIYSAFQAEAVAFLCSLQIAWTKGWRQVFESDCKGLVETNNTSSDSTDLGNLLSYIRYWMSKLPLCSIDFIHREKNQAADCLAKKSFMYNSSEYFNMPPVWLINYLSFSFTV
ncbi:hypothetical protein BRARA_H00501 [Brassica rapa]|uniref:RNase H type-1 domain-containing protein n=1 Tax=Brassica campestris TaxID=3711 RepID=A0A397Y839_BRACM|nr:hypothetical protein BRARA_H00501 [Brassica rapa]